MVTLTGEGKCGGNKGYHELAPDLIDLAKSLLEQARAAIGDAPTEIELSMFERVQRLIEFGENAINEGKQRGVGPVWRGAVISTWLID